VGLLVVLGALAGLVLASVYALLREGGVAHDDFDEFFLDDFETPQPNGTADRDDSEPWLEEASARE
jgi:hypothetical protein